MDIAPLIRTEEMIGAVNVLLAYISAPSSAHSLRLQVKHYARLGLLRISFFRTTNIRVIPNLL